MFEVWSKVQVEGAPLCLYIYSSSGHPPSDILVRLSEEPTVQCLEILKDRVC